MPQGVNVEVADGQATIDFVDRSLRGPGLAALLAIGGPETISVDTRSGPRFLYTVPEGNAREAGLLDGTITLPPATKAASVPTSPPEPAPVDEPRDWPVGEPSQDWSRRELDAYAASLGINTADLPNKGAALTAVRKAGKA